MADPTPSKRIAVAIELHWNLPWHLDCYQGIIEYGDDQGWACVTDPYLCGVTGNRDLSKYDGVIGRINPAMAERVTAAALPAVTLLYGVGLHSVRSDAASCARLAGEHLVVCGYNRLAHIGTKYNERSVTQIIFDAFVDAVIAQGGSPPQDKVVDADEFSDADRSGPARQAIARWITEQHKPIGLYIHDMATARYLSQICVELGLRIPEDVGILVHTSDKLTATSITPTLSEVAIDHWEQGRQAAAVLDRLMRGECVEPSTRYITEPRIITRESTDRFLYKDKLVSQAMRCIAERCRQGVSAEEVAAELEVSRRTLDRRFEAVLGQSVSHAIWGQRLQQIENVLIESELTMSTITELFGFGSASQFTQFFKKQAGMTPTDYRNRHRTKR